MNGQEFVERLIGSYPEGQVPDGVGLKDLVELVRYCSSGVLERLVKEVKSNFRYFPSYADLVVCMKGLGVNPERRADHTQPYWRTWKDEGSGRVWAKADGWCVVETMGMREERWKVEACGVEEGLRVFREEYYGAGGRKVREGGLVRLEDFVPEARAEYDDSVSEMEELW